MPWPSLRDYNEAIQNPHTAFSDVDLKSGKPELDALGIFPRPRTGRFASVYKIQCGQHNWAVRCFSQEVRDQQERYAAISKHLRAVALPYTINFDYLTNGIRVGKQWYPILKMEWVQGESLLSYIARKSKDTVALQQLTIRWTAMMKALQKVLVAHGDLQHGNIFIVNDDFKLVDYDGMYVPSLDGRTSNELGEPNYQHPRRSAADFGLYLDNFSAWVVYLALVALTVDGNLRARIKSDDEFLLFRKTDFDPSNLSSLLVDLEKHRDFNVRSLATVFRSMLYLEPRQIPPLDAQAPITVSYTKPAADTRVDWVLDHVKHRRQQGTAASRTASPNEQVASWVLDFISPQKAFRTFTGSMRWPRLSIGLSIALFLSIIGLAASQPTVFQALQNYGFSGPVLIFAIGITLASGLGVMNLAVIYWRFQNDPATVEMLAFRNRARLTSSKSDQLKLEIVRTEKRRAKLQSEEDEKRKELEDFLTRLHRQERDEQTRIQSELNTLLGAINNRRTNIARQEQQALVGLQSTLGARINLLNKQIASLWDSQRKEIANAVYTIESRFVENFLKRHSINEAPLRGARYTARSVLESRLRAAGITTAYDISYHRVDAIYSFGPVRTGALVDWRNNLEQIARRQIPASVINDAQNKIRNKYVAQRQALEGELNKAQAQFNSEEQATKRRFQPDYQQLGEERANLHGQTKTKMQEITDRYAKQYLEVSQKIAHLVNEYDKRKHSIDLEIAKAREQIVAYAWDLARTRHDLITYKNISLSSYLKSVLKVV